MSILLSIITINKNDGPGLEKTFESVLQFQNLAELEYIVIDGNSSDGSIEQILKKHEQLDKFIIEDDLGIFDAMNKGLKFANGEYILFLNSGDTLFSRLDLVLNTLRENNEIDVFYSDVAIKGKKNIIINYHPLLLLHHCLNHQNMIVRRKFLRSGYNIDYKYSADVKWQIDFLSKLKILKLTEPIAYFDLGGVSSNKGRRIVERIWRERWKAHYSSTGHSLIVKYATLIIISLIYITKVINPKLLSRTR